MIVHFSKYHGTGNDFILIDGRDQGTFTPEEKDIAALCHRRFGIGADGLIILEESSSADFRMRYYNSDGREGSMCGNGGRCITAFARDRKITGLNTVFEGIDGLHEASVLPGNEVRLKLKDVEGIRWLGDGYLVDTGSPHFVRFLEDVEEKDMNTEGRGIRMQERFSPAGVNVNFVQGTPHSGFLKVRTFERGVEAETLSCGTGVTASAICAYYHFKTDILSYNVETPGGKLQVSFRAKHHHRFSDIHLCGPALHVYDGTVEIGS